MRIPQGTSALPSILAIFFVTVSGHSVFAADLDVTGKLSVTGNIFWGGPIASPNVTMSYASQTVRMDAAAAAVTFAWRQNGTTTKMRLDNNNVLTLHDSGGTTKITLTPNTGIISAASFQSSGGMTSSGVLNVSSNTPSTSSANGALTVSGGIGILQDSHINGIRIGEGGGSLAGNTALGAAVLANNTTGGSNAGAGYYVLNKNTTGSNNTGLGRSALANNTTGSLNVAIGSNAGSYLHNGTSFLSDPESSIYIGANSRGYSNADSNSIVIGAGALGAGANTTVIGTTATTQAFIYGNVVTGGITVNGPAVLSAAQGDISMGEYGY